MPLKPGFRCNKNSSVYLWYGVHLPVIVALLLIAGAAFSEPSVSTHSCSIGSDIRIYTSMTMVKGRITDFLKHRSRDKGASKKEPEHPAEKRFRIPSQITDVFSKAGEELVRTADRYGIGALLKKYGRKLIFLGICAAVILAAISFYSGRYESRRFLTTTRLSIMDKEVQRACRYIEDNYNDPELSLSNISRVLVTGEAFLEALFEKELGLTLDGFINQVRINRVKIQLRHSPGEDVQVLAVAAGYRDGSTMAAAFESICGCDIATYRRTVAECGNG